MARNPLSPLLRIVLFVVLLLAVGLRASQAQEGGTGEPTFNLYGCEFVAATNSVRLHTAVYNGSGRPVPPTDFLVTVTNAETNAPVEPESVAAAAPRPPLDMILVLDITDTVPVEEIVNAVSAELLTGLELEDQAALITFADSVAPRTRFYVDKNQLVNENLLDLIPIGGDNRINDAILAAVTGFPSGSARRKVVLVLTDSAAREVEQVSADDIIAQAQRGGVEVYVIGFNSFLDQPDAAAMRALTDATDGYFWLYDAPFISREGIEAGVGDFLDDLTELLEGEYAIEVDIAGQQPNANGILRFAASADFGNELILTDEIACLVEELEHTIFFASDLDSRAVTTPTDITVTVETDLNRDDTVVRFLRSGEVVQEGAEDTYVFDPAGLQPGRYEIGAQLLNRSGDVLASTPVILRLFVQASLSLTVQQEDGAAAFELTADSALDLPSARIDVSPAGDDGTQRALFDEPIEFTDGRAQVQLADLRARLGELFPEIPSRVRITASIPGVTAGDPPLGVSNALVIDTLLPATPVPAAPAPLTLPSFDVNLPLVALVLSLVLLVVNWLLFGAIRRVHVRKLINTPDNYELSPQLMTITVRREGVRQAHTLTRKTITVGRGSSNDINLGDDPNISRQHGVIMWRKNRWYYASRKPRVLVRINGKRYRGYYVQELKPITEIEIGQALLVFHSNAQTDISEFIDTNL